MVADDRAMDCLESGEKMGQEDIVTKGFAWINHEGEKVRQEFLKVLARTHKKPGRSSDVLKLTEIIESTGCRDQLTQADHDQNSTLSIVISFIHHVPLTTTPGVRRDVTFLQQESLMFPPTIAWCPRGDLADSERNLNEENFFLITEEGDQGRVPVLLIRPVGQSSKRPSVVFLHSTGRRKEFLRPYMRAFAGRGYVAVAIDCRHHGERAASVNSYNEALISAWRNGDEMPFVFDTVWDLIKLVDYLSERQDVDPARIGVLGVSLGGMHAWFAAVADPRIAVVVPIIGVQNFKWAVANEMWHARVQSIPHAFEVAKEDLRKPTVDAETVTAVWKRIAPGLIDKFDADHTIPTIAPRPLLIINGEMDPRCPVKGLEEVLIKVAAIYKTAGVPENFQFKAEKGVDHAFCMSMGYDASIWMDHFLKPDKPLR